MRMRNFWAQNDSLNIFQVYPFGQYCQETYLETQSKVSGGAFFAKIVNDFQPLTIFEKSSIIDVRLISKETLDIMSEAYLECSQKSKVECFCKNGEQLLAVNYFCKKAPSQIFHWVLNRLQKICLRRIQNLVKSIVQRFHKNS